MLTILGATHTLTQEMIVLCAALGAFLLGIVYLALDAARRNRRRIEAQNRPIDTSMFEPPQDTPPPEETAPEIAEDAPPEAIAEAPVPDETMAEAELPAETILDEPAAPEAAPEPTFISPAFTAPAFATIRPILICDGYGAGFGPKLVLTDMSFAVPGEGITTLMGPNGAGKSTLLRALSGALGQSGLFREWGHAWFRGAPLTAENRPLLVTQRVPLVQRPVLENLMFHLRGRTEHMAEEKQCKWAANWLHQAGAGHLAEQLDQPFMALDLLSQRIVTILREAAAEPALLMLDEPAQGLDEGDASALLSLLQRLAEFTPLLLVLQNQKHARRVSDRILLAAGGQVQAACGAAEFFDAPPNAMVAQFLETGSCNAPAPDASAIRQLGPIPPVPPLFSPGWAAPEPEMAFVPEEEETPLAAAPEEFPPEDFAPEPEDAPPETGPADEAVPLPPSPDDLAAIKDEIRSALAMEMDTAEEPEGWATEPPDEMPAAWAPDAAETLPEPALEAVAEDEAALLPPETPHIVEAAEPELYEAEFLTAPVSFNTTSGGGFTIDIEHDEPPPADESAPHDELPPINLSANMIQSVPLPPRAAAAQMSAPDSDPQRFERAAVFRNPGSGGTPGPRGFVWIEEGRLAATPVPGFSGPVEADLDLLKDAGITVLITLTEQDFPQSQLARHGLRNVHFPIAEQNAPSTGATDMLVSQMREMLAEGEVLAVHSHASLGRTGTILAAYMVKEQGLSAQAALNQIRRFNQQFVQTDEQEDFLMEYEVQQEQTVLHHRATGHGPKLLR